MKEQATLQAQEAARKVRDPPRTLHGKPRFCDWRDLTVPQAVESGRADCAGRAWTACPAFDQHIVLRVHYERQAADEQQEKAVAKKRDECIKSLLTVVQSTNEVRQVAAMVAKADE